jgi:hypothetical protein
LKLWAHVSGKMIITNKNYVNSAGKLEVEEEFMIELVKQ